MPSLHEPGRETLSAHRRARSRIAFWGDFGTGNLGNECTLYAALDAVRRHVPDADPLVVCSKPADMAQRPHAEAVPIALPLSSPRRYPRSIRRARHLHAEIRDWSRVTRTMRAADALVMTGTGMLADQYESFLGMPFQMLKWAAAARWCGKEVVFLSVGVESLLDPARIQMMRLALRLAHYRSFRDRASGARATRLLKASARDPLFPDLAFSLPASLTTGHPSPPSDTPTVAVGLYAVEGHAMPAYLEAVGAFVVRLLDRGFGVRLVIGDTRYDQEAREGMQGWLRARGVADRVADDPAMSFQELMDQLAGVDFVVATRLHNLVLAFLLAKPAVSISHMDKDDELMAAMGSSAYCVQLQGVEANQILDSFDRMQRHADEIRHTVRDRVRLFREKLEEQYANVFGGIVDRRATRGAP